MPANMTTSRLSFHAVPSAAPSWYSSTSILFGRRPGAPSPTARPFSPRAGGAHQRLTDERSHDRSVLRRRRLPRRSGVAGWCARSTAMTIRSRIYRGGPSVDRGASEASFVQQLPNVLAEVLECLTTFFQEFVLDVYPGNTIQGTTCTTMTSSMIQNLIHNVERVPEPRHDCCCGASQIPQIPRRDVIDVIGFPKLSKLFLTVRLHQRCDPQAWIVGPTNGLDVIVGEQKMLVPSLKDTLEDPYERPFSWRKNYFGYSSRQKPNNSVER